MLVHYYSVSLLALFRNTLIVSIKISLSTVYQFIFHTAARAEKILPA